ncbi:glycosyltransferase family 2 protein [Treponema putidum]|uniref:Glycosyltransferase family 2 protein n=1 Tax=Treponema putidum TaxID=221027 RepID=A0AAE9SJH1_9SPIR|nr:glycosyltransferase family 2 protein [Treponema putidum]UTY33212.1 glycosyltransferase family 2 protein [Treponema putidum]
MKNEIVPRYSIILPVKNVRPYIESAINSVLYQNYLDYELIISDNQSDDGTSEYVDAINHDNVKVFHTPRHFTIAEHFNWAQSHAVGIWQIYLGGDDAVQPYFFTLADKLTTIAESKKISAISSRRGYYFWNGCQEQHGDVCVSYSAEDKYKILSAKKEMYKALCGKLPCGYFDLPQMYTTSLFHKSMIDEIRQRQNDLFLHSYTIQDAALAAISILFSEKILRSEIPLGWVGTSPKTAFREKTWSNNFKLRPESGDFNIASLELYFFDSLLTIMEAIPEVKIKKLFSSFFKIKMFASILANIEYAKEPNKYDALLKVIKVNNCSITLVKLYIKISFIYIKILNFIRYVFRFSWHCIRYTLKRIPFTKKYFINKTSIKNDINLYVSWNDDPNMTMQKASEMVMDLINKNIYFEEFKL